MALFSSLDLTTHKIIDILTTERSKAVKRIYKAKGQDVFIFDTEGGNNSKSSYCYQ
jgi:uroporphyrinogen-III decarboxylase